MFVIKGTNPLTRKDMYQLVKKDREEYTNLVVDVDPIFKEGVVNRVYPKACFEKSWQYMILSLCPSELRLVHGTCRILEKLDIEHGWIEIGENIVFEGVYQRFYDKQKYYEARGLVKRFEYTYEEVVKLSYKYKHKGPWYTQS